MSAEFCSLGGASTFIDTNLVNLNVFDAGNTVKYLMGAEPEGVPIHAWSDVLHESVHHWCFDTHVGAAVSLARAEIMERALGDETAHRLRRLVVRYEAVVGALRPLVEGLACFAEFDAFPGNGAVRATPLAWLAVLAQPAAALANQTIEDQDALIGQVLRQLRGLERTALRKDILLAHPLDPQRLGGYLTGYLLVKGLQRKVLHATELARDSELWLSFLRAFVFEDLAIASAIVSPAVPDSDLSAEWRAAELIVERLQSLQNERYAGEFLERFNEACRGGDGEAVISAALGNSPEGRQAHDELVEGHLERLSSASEEPSIAVVRQITRERLNNRGWLCVSSLPGQATINSSGRLVFTEPGSGFPRYVPPVDRVGVEGLVRIGPRVDHSAALEFWLGPTHRSGVVMLTTLEGVLDYTILWGSDQTAIDTFVAAARSNQALMQTTSRMRSTIDALLEKQAWRAGSKEILNDHLRQLLRRQSELAVALYDGDASAMDVLWVDGFDAVFQDLNLLKAFAAIGLLMSTVDGAHPWPASETVDQALDLAYCQGLLHGGLRIVDLDAWEPLV